MESKKYIIVGAGSAGCVLANRLSANPQDEVLLLEAGKPDKKKEIHIPLTFSLLFKSEYDWAYHTEPQKQLNNRVLYHPRGKTLGGSSSLNAMIFIRGHQKDYDTWSQLGNKGWSYDEVLPYFRKAEQYQQTSLERHSEAEHLPTNNRRYTNVVSTSFLEACQDVGIPTISTLNSPDLEGAGLYQVTQKNGQRYSAAKAYLKPILNRKNLTVFTEAQVTRLILEERRLAGVEYFHKGKKQQVFCEQEVILCGGAINTPQLLMLSGIGPGSHLKELGIPVVLDSPGTGQNLQDHLIATVTYQSQIENTLDSAEKISNLLQYLFFKRGPLTSNLSEAGGFLKTESQLEQPDLQLHFIPAYCVDHGFIKPKGAAFSFCPTLIRPKSVGYVKLSSHDPLESPKIQPNYLSDQSDLSVLIQGIKLSREIAKSSVFDSFRTAEYLPGKEVQTDAEIAEYIRNNAETIYHPVGTCKMGNDQMSVVDSDLKVIGVEKLRVVDASIMPTIISSNTNATTIMIAEKAADLIKQEMLVN